MIDATELLDLEHETWKALGDPASAQAFYDRFLADDVLMLLPGGLVIDDRDTVIQSMEGAGWDRHELSDEYVLKLSEDSAVVGYRATAHRGDQAYTALFSSTWVRGDDGWKLAFHQQTPV